MTVLDAASQADAAAAIPAITIEGPPAERGRQYGRAAGERIAAALALYGAEFARKGVGPDDMRAIAARFVPHLEAYDAALVAELRGIAAGAEQPLEAIVALNARTEILFWHYRERHRRAPTPSEAPAEECTALAVMPEATADGQVIHAQNWDWNPGCAAFAVVLRIAGGSGPEILTFVEAGQLARHGFNAAGIAVTANGLHSDQDYGRLGIPNPLIRRRMLQAPTLGVALGEMMQAKRAFSHNLIVSHVDGLAFSLETTPDDCFVLEPEDGILVHANHFKHPGALARVRDIGLPRSPESVYRDRRVRDGLARKLGRIGRADVEAVLADRWGSPDAVCRSPAAREGGMVSATVATLIMEPASRTMRLAPLPFAHATFTTYRLD